jgi:hypothetical protein
MPLQLPSIDDRRYQELLDEALARIPVHNPEWTNFNRSDPGVTLIEVFSFMTENLLYRANLIPERNRRKFLQLLGLPLQPASSARGLVTFTNERGPLQTITLNSELELRAGQVPFRTERGLDVLPVEAQIYYKRIIQNPDPKLTDYYKQLYASYQGQSLDETVDLQLYETVPLDERNIAGVALGEETVDSSLWVALLARAGDKPTDNTEEGRAKLRDDVRAAIAGKTLSLGLTPALNEATQTLSPGGQANPESATLLSYELPKLPPDGKLSDDPLLRVPEYRPLEARSVTDVLAQPGVVEITLPSAPELQLWSNLNPLEPGVNDFPPALEDTKLNDRLLTWLRVRATAATVRARIMWAGINATTVTQRTRVANENLPAGNGEPDQMMRLSHAPVIPYSVHLFVTANGRTDEWKEIDDLLSAGPEVPAQDLRQPPGVWSISRQPAEVFTAIAESGEIRFGDGAHGKRPPTGALIRATYDYGLGAAGNVGAGSINSSPALPAGLKATNPIRTWGGADAESVTTGEKQITRYLQHRDRLVTTTDFETITLRAPGVEIGRVEVIPALNPELTPSEPGDAPGAVTLMLIPRHDPQQPDAPLPDRLFLDTICKYLDQRRLVTTEVFLRGPVYKPIWISVGINVLAGWAIAEVREAVKQALLEFLAPLKRAAEGLLDNQTLALTAPQYADRQKGWPLRKPVTERELIAVASRVSGVMFVNDALLAEGTKPEQEQIPMTGLELPRVMGISVVVGDPMPLDQLRGQATPTSTDGGTTTTPTRRVPVPVILEEC